MGSAWIRIELDGSVGPVQVVHKRMGGRSQRYGKVQRHGHGFSVTWRCYQNGSKIMSDRRLPPPGEKSSVAEIEAYPKGLHRFFTDAFDHAWGVLWRVRRPVVSMGRTTELVSLE